MTLYFVSLWGTHEGRAVKLGDNALEIEVVQGYVQDRSTGLELVPMITEGDLVLRDMGYFDVSSFGHRPVAKSLFRNEGILRFG
jgi:hypothetical protein